MKPRYKTILAFLFGVAFLSVTCCDVFSQTNGLPRDVQVVLENADSFTLFSINPMPDLEHKSKDTFQDHAIVGRLRIRLAATRKELVDALNEGIRAAAQSLWADQCFNPRHGIRAKKGDETVELLICFECRQIVITSPSATNLLITTADPATTFNEVLKHARVPLPEN